MTVREERKEEMKKGKNHKPSRRNPGQNEWREREREWERERENEKEREREREEEKLR